MSVKFIPVLLFAMLSLVPAQARKSEKSPVNHAEAQTKTLYTNVKAIRNDVHSRINYTVTAEVRVNFSYLELRDYDNDGIPNKYDLCPETPGTYRRRGCPEFDLRKIVSFAKNRMRISKSNLETAVNAFSRLQFNDSYGLLSSSTQYLDEFVALMKRNRHWSITVSSHFCDGAKSNKRNRIISEQRLNSVLEYMTRKGIDKKRITGYFFGDSRPVIDLPASRFEVEFKY